MDNGIFSYLMKDDALNLDTRLLFIQSQSRQQMPGNGLSLAVGVSCQQEPIGIFQCTLDSIEMFLALGQHMVLGLEILFDIHRPLLAGQCADMTKGCQHLVIRAQEFFYGFRLGRRFDNDEVLRHMMLYPYTVFLLSGSCVVRAGQRRDRPFEFKVK